MKCNVIIDRERDEEVIIYTHQKNELTDQIEELVSEYSTEIIGYEGGRIHKLEVSEIHAFTIEGGKVFALYERGRCEVRMRLYALEERLPVSFVKINQSCIGNVKKIACFDITIGGALTVKFKNGYTDYVSRRQIKAVKERIGFKL